MNEEHIHSCLSLFLRCRCGPIPVLSLTFLCLSCSPVNVHSDRFRDVEGVYISTPIGSTRLQTRGLSSLGLLFGLCWPYVHLGGPATGEWYMLNKSQRQSFYTASGSCKVQAQALLLRLFFFDFSFVIVWRRFDIEPRTCSATELHPQPKKMSLEFNVRNEEEKKRKKKMKRRRHSSSFSHGLCSLSRLQCTNLGKMLFSHPGWTMFLPSGRVDGTWAATLPRVVFAPQ